MKQYKVSDSELLASYKNGNEAAFEKLVKRYKSKVYTIIYLIVKDQDVANDLLQDSFVKVVTTIKSGKYNEEGKFLPWICRIAHNMAIDYFRKEKRYPMVMMDDNTAMFNRAEFAEESYETVQIKRETHQLLREMVQNLPEPQREVLVMRHYAQMSFQEIADSTGVSINTALGRMRYALINLRKQMEQRNIRYEKTYLPR